MAVESNRTEGTKMADEVKSDNQAEANDRRDELDEEAESASGEGAAAVPPATAAAAPAGGPGFMHVYKPGQGYWTRMCTIAGAVIVFSMLGYKIYQTLEPPISNWFYSSAPLSHMPRLWSGVITGALGIAAIVALWHYLNKPSIVDFLIATESEMKKVNWTSRKDLFGSTKVVIFFMFLIAAVLFLIDVMFGYLFYFMHVLKYPPL